MWKITAYSGLMYVVCSILSMTDTMVAAWMMVGIAMGYVENQRR